MRAEILDEARRQAGICNACRYCEGFCAVFPELQSRRAFTDGDIALLANVCHDCRGCFYACQYAPPHEFGVNLPKALSEVRNASWAEYAWPSWFARAFQRGGASIALGTVLGFALILGAVRAIPSGGGAGFYSVLSHGTMVAIFLPAFLFPVLSLGIGIRRFWRAAEGGSLRWSALKAAVGSTARMRNLSGGHGDGCNFEDEDRFTHARRHGHHATMYGFLLCFLATASGTILHYALDMPAPYPLLSLPKLLGVPGGALMVIGTAWLAALKLKADKQLGDATAWGGDMAFVLLLFLVASTGLALYALGSTRLMPAMLVLHLGSVLSLFVLAPFTKMAHGPYRLAALAR